MTEATPARPRNHRAQILLVDDHPILRYGLALLINQEADMTVCGEEEDASKALNAISQLKPDLVIVDLSLKGSSGLDLIRNIKAQYSSVRMLVLSLHDELVFAEVAFRAGALGYLMKEEASEKIITAIRRVLSGQIYLSDALAAKMLQQQALGQSGTKDSLVKRLSDRELEILQLIGQWKKTSEIAQQLRLSVNTIESYRQQIKRKLNVTSGSELVRYASSWVRKEFPT